VAPRIAAHLLPDTARIGDDGRLSVGGVDVAELAAEFGTPVYVYDEEHLRARCREAVATFGPGVAYATKAFLCTAMAKLAHDEGMHLDVATIGELHVAEHAGVPPSDCVLHGNNKSTHELRVAMQAGVGRIVIDSFDEIDRIEAIHAETSLIANALIRVTPGVEAHTHEYIATGQDDSKFGFTVSSGLAAQAVERATASPAINLLGIHAHIGSQVFRVDSFAQAAGVLAELSAQFELPELSVGGGLGVPYVTGEEAPTIAQWGKAVLDALGEAGVSSNVLAEPGRSIVATAGMTIYEVGTIKHLDGIRTYVAVDGGMSDNPRPVLYGSGYEATRRPAALGRAQRDARRSHPPGRRRLAGSIATA